MTMKEDADGVAALPFGLDSTILDQLKTKEDMEALNEQLIQFIGDKGMPAYNRFSAKAAAISLKANDIQNMIRKLANDLNEYVEDLHAIGLDPGTY
jgi:hypothetical protein